MGVRTGAGGRPGRKVPRWSSAAIAALALLLAPGTVSADTELGESGRVGPHLLVDTPTSPGARCDDAVVDGGLRFAQMEVQPPVVYPSGGRARQKVAWTVRLQRKRPDAAGWRTKLVSDTFVRRATASAPAAFVSTWVTWSSGAELRWRVIVDIDWRHEGVTVGSSRHRVDSYAIGESMDVAAGGCANLMADPALRSAAMEAS